MAGNDGESEINIFKDALDDLVNVNSLFTIAVFVGLSIATPGEESLEDRPECQAGASHAKLLVVFEVVSFSFFLLSSLVAKSVKVNLEININLKKTKDNGQPPKALNKALNILKWLLLVLSVVASFMGCFFLMLSMIYVIQIRLGKLSCHSPYTQVATFSMISIVSIAILIHGTLVVIALKRALEALLD